MADPPSDYIHPFTPDEVNKRFEALGNECALYVKAMSARHPKWNLRFDVLLLKHVAQSALDDIWRYKTYHLAEPDKLSDAVKRAAYFTKWIVKIRPIYVQRPHRAKTFRAAFDNKDGTIFVNEDFAIFHSLQTIATELDQQKVALAPAFFNRLLYDLHFRQLADDALLAIYQIIKDVAQDTQKKDVPPRSSIIKT